jgi:leader peptidase (prepilin peptidase)/N-methyltransferase
VIEPGLFLGVIAALAGMMIGSFLNVVIYRLPKNESIVLPGSHCTSCNSAIKWYHNIPILSYFILRGKCANCGESFSFRYAFVEMLTGTLWFWGFYKYALPEAILFVIIVSILIAISFIDIDLMIIPLVLILMALVVLFGYYLIYPENAITAIWGMLMGVCYLGGVYLLTKGMFKKETMGMGDLQLIAVLGSWIGPMNIAATIFLGSLITLIAFGIANRLSGKEADRALPFGPFLAFTGIAMFMLNPDWMNVMKYLHVI